MIISIREIDKRIYLFKNWEKRFSKQELENEPYKYKFLNVPFYDVTNQDFIGLEFSLDKYTQRKEKEQIRLML